jgi:acyl phosphate:glycerol-3-phosphate acyltransferase
MIEKLALLDWPSAWPYAAASFLAGYVLGSIPFGLIFARLAGAGDVRKIGSGNIGATNVLRTGKKWAAAATLLFDALKGAVAVAAARDYLSLEVFYLLAGLGAFLGHLFPVWLGFRGGKGVATFLGIVFTLSLPVGLLACASWLATAGAIRKSSLAALVAAAATPVYFLIFGKTAFAAFAAILAILIFTTHRSNISRLVTGAEPKIGTR